MPIKTLVSNIKEKKEVKRKAVKEAEQIFMKLNKNLAMKDGSFPKAGPDMPRAYNKEARRTEKQVVKTRLAIWRNRLNK